MLQDQASERDAARPAAWEWSQGAPPARAPWWERNVRFLLPLPTLLLMLLFVIYPTITALLFSFNHIEITRDGLVQRFIGLENFGRAFQDHLIISSVRITLQWILVVTVVEMLLGLGLALLVSSGIRLRGLAISLLIIPIMLLNIRRFRSERVSG